MTTLKLTDPVDARLPWVRKLHNLDAAWDKRIAGARCRALEAAGREVGDALRGDAPVVSVQSIDGAVAPYPVRFAFNATVPCTPNQLLFMHNRALLIQVQAEGELRNILFNPTDPVASAQTPFFAKLQDATPALLSKFLQPKQPPWDEILGAWGLTREDIDLVVFDHFHTQDLRPIIGSKAQPGRFPNALLIAPEIEWQDWGDIHPMQRAFFIPEGRDGLDMDRVVLSNNDLQLGTGCVLLRTPGHTTGNQTIFVHTESGVWGSSENGTSADAWTPAASRIGALRKAASYYDLDVILNTNTPEIAGHQYASMLLERSVVDRVADRPEFVQMLPSSEVTFSLLAPQVRPSMVFGGLSSGEVQSRQSAAGASRAA